jgi:hypothetical protein
LEEEDNLSTSLGPQVAAWRSTTPPWMSASGSKDTEAGGAGTRRRRGEPGHEAEAALVDGLAGVGGGRYLGTVRSYMCGPDSAES